MRWFCIPVSPASGIPQGYFPNRDAATTTWRTRRWASLDGNTRKSIGTLVEVWLASRDGSIDIRDDGTAVADPKPIQGDSWVLRGGPDLVAHGRRRLHDPLATLPAWWQEVLSLDDQRTLRLWRCAYHRHWIDVHVALGIKKR